MKQYQKLECDNRILFPFTNVAIANRKTYWAYGARNMVQIHHLLECLLPCGGHGNLPIVLLGCSTEQAQQEPLHAQFSLSEIAQSISSISMFPLCLVSPLEFVSGDAKCKLFTDCIRHLELFFDSMEISHWYSVPQDFSIGCFAYSIRTLYPLCGACAEVVLAFEWRATSFCEVHRVTLILTVSCMPKWVWSSTLPPSKHAPKTYRTTEHGRCCM